MAIDVISGISTLNPNAPIFIPSAYRTVEDFSDEWWDLVHSSPWFCDYWLQECFSDPQIDNLFADSYDHVLPDIDALFDHTNSTIKQEEREDQHKDLAPFGWVKWRKPRGMAETPPRYFEKAPKIVNVKVSPRMIQQQR